MIEKVRETSVEITQEHETLEVSLWDNGNVFLSHTLETGSGSPPRQNYRYDTLTLYASEAEALGLALIGYAALSRDLAEQAEALAG